MRRLALILGVAGLAAVAAVVEARARPEQAAPTITTRVIWATFDVQPSTVGNFDVSCPPGWVAMAGMVVSAGPGVQVPGSFSLVRRIWRFRAGNVSAQTQQFTVAVTCTHSSAVFTISFATPKKNILVNTGYYGLVTVPCPPGQAPTGAGFDLQPAPEPQRTGRIAHLDIAFTTMRPLPGGWLFGIRNRGPRARGELSVGCVRRTSRRHRLVVGRSSFRAKVPVEVLSSTFRRCPRGWSGIYAGYAAPPEVDVSGWLQRDGRGGWRWGSSSSSELSLSLDLLCLRRGLRAR